MNQDDESNRTEVQAPGEERLVTSLARSDSAADVGPMPDPFEAGRLAKTPVAPADVGPMSDPFEAGRLAKTPVAPADVGPMPDPFAAGRLASTPVAPADVGPMSDPFEVGRLAKTPVAPADVGPMPDPFAAGRLANTPVAPADVILDPESAADWEPVDDQGPLEYTNDPASGGLPRPIARGCVVLASLTLIVAMIAVALTGFTGSTWNYNAHRMDRETSERLVNLADAMAAAGAPRAAVVHVRAAAQPNINRGAALEALATAVQILAASGDDAHLVPLRRQLHRAYLEIYEKEYGTPPTPERQRPTVPSFEARKHFDFRFWILDFGLVDIA